MFLKKLSIVASMALILSMGVVSFSNAEENDYEYMSASETAYVDGRTYIFDESGNIIYKKGWISFIREDYEGARPYTDWYYSNGDGTVKIEQWIKENNKWYYAMYDGRIVCEQSFAVNGKWYIFDKSGAMIEKKGWVKLYDAMSGNDIWYYANGDGTMKIDQWLKENNKWYYLSENDGYSAGAMLQGGSFRVNEKLYLFDSNGAMVEKKGWVSVSNGYETEWYYCNGDGTTKEEEWINSNNKWYYVGIFGSMLRDITYEINGEDYIFDTNGVCLNP